MKIRASVLTVSDTRTPETDLSGGALCSLLADDGIEVVDHRIVKDDAEAIRDALLEGCDKGVDLILTTGGTGFAPRDNTPEATLRVIERETPGISETLRRETSQKNPRAILSRGVSGIRGRTFIVNCPGSVKGVTEYFDVLRPVLPHIFDQLSGNTSHGSE
jgi:molybdenum cofactor synthesis domain-containing protein